MFIFPLSDSDWSLNICPSICNNTSSIIICFVELYLLKIDINDIKASRIQYIKWKFMNSITSVVEIFQSGKICLILERLCQTKEIFFCQTCQNYLQYSRCFQITIDVWFISLFQQSDHIKHQVKTHFKLILFWSLFFTCHYLYLNSVYKLVNITITTKSLKSNHCINSIEHDSVTFA